MCCAQDLPGFLRRGYFSLQEYQRRSFSTRKPAHRCSAVIQVSYSASYNVGRRPLRKAAWFSGSLWPNRPEDHSTRKRTWWARPLGDFQSRINPRLIQTEYPRVGCDSRGRLTLAKWETVPSRFWAISLYSLRSWGPRSDVVTQHSSEIAANHAVCH